MKRIVPVAIAVICNRKTKKFLLTQRKEVDREDKPYGHCWNFPGGGIEWGEDPVKALSREINEELGVDVVAERLLPKIFSPVRGPWHGLLICYLCHLKDEKQPIRLNHESLRFGWFSLEEIKQLKLLPLGLEVATLAMSIL